MKGKGVAMADDKPLPAARLAGDSDYNPLPAARFAARNASSKYDFVKVKVWLGDNADHYYVLSRFLLSRMLTVTKIPGQVAIKIALELKKLLIDNSLLDVSQSDLEANLFKLMERRGYSEEYINRYKMMTRFHHQRVPLVILVCGTACSGKSTIATQLAQRLNLPNVLQTDMVYELLRTSTDAPLASTPAWTRDFSSPEELITEFCRECRIVRKGLGGDLKKAMKDGKPIIIEVAMTGIHLDPTIYLMDEENSLRNSQVKNEEQSTEEQATEMAKFGNSSASQTRTLPDDGEADMKTDKSNFVDIGDATKNGISKTFGKREKLSAEPIIIPIVLKMAEFDHKALLEEWVSTRSHGTRKDEDKVIRNLKTIQNYLCSFEPQSLTVVNISASTYPQTLDWLHGYLLQCIERGCNRASETS